MKKTISVSNLTLELYLDYIAPAAKAAGIAKEADIGNGLRDYVTEETIAAEIETAMRCACFNAGHDGVERTLEEYTAHEAEQMICQLEVSIKYCKDADTVEALSALRDAMEAHIAKKTAEKIVEKIAEKVEQTKTRSAWDRGVKAYAEKLIEELAESVDGGYTDATDLSNWKLTEKALLNGASDWRQYSEGGSSLCYDFQIAERLCAPWELRKTERGLKDPNPRETWIDVQSRALFQAAQMIRRSYEAVRA